MRIFSSGTFCSAVFLFVACVGCCFCEDQEVRVITTDGRELIGVVDVKTESMRITHPFKAVIPMRKDDIKSVSPITTNDKLDMEYEREARLAEGQKRRRQAGDQILTDLALRNAERQAALEDANAKKLDALSREEDRVVAKHNLDASEFNAAQNRIDRLKAELAWERTYNGSNRRDLSDEIARLEEENALRKRRIDSYRKKQDDLIERANRPR